MSPTLSILIPTVKGREDVFYPLLHSLEMDILGLESLIEIQYLSDDKTMTIGEKRNKLYEMANGLYSLQVDDDDQLAPGWPTKLLNALVERPDCVTYGEKVIIDSKRYHCNHSLTYDDWADNVPGWDFVRTPYMKDVIRTSIARSVRVPHIRFGEDHQWSRLLKPYLHEEVHLYEDVYYYLHNSSDPNERYGLDKE